MLWWHVHYTLCNNGDFCRCMIYDALWRVVNAVQNPRPLWSCLTCTRATVLLRQRYSLVVTLNIIILKQRAALLRYYWLIHAGRACLLKYLPCSQSDKYVCWEPRNIIHGRVCCFHKVILLSNFAKLIKPNGFLLQKKKKGPRISALWLLAASVWVKCLFSGNHKNWLNFF